MELIRKSWPCFGAVISCSSRDPMWDIPRGGERLIRRVKTMSWGPVGGERREVEEEKEEDDRWCPRECEGRRGGSTVKWGACIRKQRTKHKDIQDAAPFCACSRFLKCIQSHSTPAVLNYKNFHVCHLWKVLCYCRTTAFCLGTQILRFTFISPSALETCHQANGVHLLRAPDSLALLMAEVEWCEWKKSVIFIVSNR